MKANRPVDHKPVYEAICKEMGITIDQFGRQGDDTDGTWWVVRWTQWAFKDLSDQRPPLTVSMGKGKWALTTHGVGKAQTMGNRTMTPAVTATGEVRNEGLSYHPDPYIQSLAVANTPCAAGYAETEKICSDCPIQELCRNLQMAAYSNLARELAKEDEARQKEIEARNAQEAAARAAAEAAKKNPAPVPPSNTTPPANPSGTKITGAHEVVCQQKAQCHKCNGDMEKDSMVVWVRTSGGAAGLYHIPCYEELVTAGEAEPLIRKMP